jgi:HSP20 family protein
MATRNETTNARQQDQYTGQQGQQSSSARSGEAGSEVRSDREQTLQTGREGRSQQTGVVRSGTPGRGVTASGATRSPFALMRRMMDDMDRLFEDFGFGRGFGSELGLGRGLTTPLLGDIGRDLWGETSNESLALWSPAVEVLEKGDKLVVRAEVPGVSKDDVSIDVTDDVLTIQGERRQESEDRGEGFYRSERAYGRFLRTIPLPEGTDPDKAEARFKDGVLEVTLPAPKRETKRGRKIAIR